MLCSHSVASLCVHHHAVCEGIRPAAMRTEQSTRNHCTLIAPVTGRSREWPWFAKDHQPPLLIVSFATSSPRLPLDSVGANLRMLAASLALSARFCHLFGQQHRHFLVQACQFAAFRYFACCWVLMCTSRCQTSSGVVTLSQRSKLSTAAVWTLLGNPSAYTRRTMPCQSRFRQPLPNKARQLMSRQDQQNNTQTKQGAPIGTLREYTCTLHVVHCRACTGV